MNLVSNLFSSALTINLTGLFVNFIIFCHFSILNFVMFSDIVNIFATCSGTPTSSIPIFAPPVMTPLAV